MQHKKDYLCFGENDTNRPKAHRSTQADRVRKIRPGKNIVVASIPVYQCAFMSLTNYARSLGNMNDLFISPNPKADYFYKMKHLINETQLIIGRNR